MAANENWPRWIFASISKHFDDKKQTRKLYITGAPRIDTPGALKWFELRIDGPNVTEVSKGTHLTEVEVNMLVTVKKDETDLYLIHTEVGIALTAFEDIPLFRYGSEAGDVGTQFGCLSLIQEGRDKLEVRHYGQLDADVNILQATVEGHYKTFLDE